MSLLQHRHNRRKAVLQSFVMFMGNGLPRPDGPRNDSGSRYIQRSRRGHSRLKYGKAGASPRPTGTEDAGSTAITLPGTIRMRIDARHLRAYWPRALPA